MWRKPSNLRGSFNLLLPVVILIAFWPATLLAQSSSGAYEQRILEKIEANEPSLAQLRRQVLRVRGWEEPDLDRWSSRARWSHLLPDLKGEAAWLDQRDVQARYREDISATDQGLMFRDGGQNNFYDDSRLRSVYAVTARWQLAGLVYDRSEPRIASEVRQRQKAREKLLIEVGEAYYARRRFQIEWALTPAAQWRKRIETQLEVDRFTARLDAMSSGWFSAQITKMHQNRDTKQ